MQLIRTRAYARAGLMGNPSDGYHGKTLSLIVRNFYASVVLYEWPTLEIVWSQEDQSRFRSIRDLADDVRLHGYYGGVRLVKATLKRFLDYCDAQKISLHARNFSIRYQTNIPRNVGLAGSSAIIVATLRALIAWYELQEEDIPKNVLPSLALSVETGELGIIGGLQDRVIQVYEGLVYMDFSREHVSQQRGFECGVYESLDPGLLPPLYIAFSSRVGEPTEKLHKPLRVRFEQGDPEVVAAMKQFARLTDAAKAALARGDIARLNELVNQNFDLRRRICDLSPAHIRMVAVARGAGGSAKFAGSGGAIIGIYRDEAHFASLREALVTIGCEVLKPVVI